MKQDELSKNTLVLKLKGFSLSLSLSLSLSAGSLEEPRVLRTYTSCRGEHMNYCSNGGECIYPQDTEKLACM